MSEFALNILKNWSVVVIDDDPMSLIVASTILRHYGAHVTTAINGDDGLQAIRNTQPKFVISDLSMPVMDGWALIDKLKRERGLSEIPVIALTAHAMTGDRQRAIAAGFHNYLTKPLTPSTFISELISLLIDIPQFSQHFTSEVKSSSSEVSQ